MADESKLRGSSRRPACWFCNGILVKNRQSRLVVDPRVFEGGTTNLLTYIHS